MEQNYTPLELDKFEDNKTTTFLLLLATITLAILAVVLFLFIQRKLKEKNQSDYQSLPKQENLTAPISTDINKKFSPSPSPIVTEAVTFPTSSPSPTEVVNNEETLLPASPSPTGIISPTIGKTLTQP